MVFFKGWGIGLPTFGVGQIPERVKSCGFSFTYGFFGRFAERVTGQKYPQYSLGKVFDERMAAKCHPWTNHLEGNTINSIHDALRLGDFVSARGLAAIGVKEGASRYCITVLEGFIDLMAKGYGEDVEFSAWFLE